MNKFNLSESRIKVQIANEEIKRLSKEFNQTMIELSEVLNGGWK